MPCALGAQAFEFHLCTCSKAQMSGPVKPLMVQSQPSSLSCPSGHLPRSLIHWLTEVLCHLDLQSCLLLALSPSVDSTRLTWNPLFRDLLCFRGRMWTGTCARPNPASEEVTNGLMTGMKAGLTHIPTPCR